MAIDGSDAGNDQINLVATSTEFNSYFGCLTCGCRTMECVQCHAIKNKIKNRALDKVKKIEISTTDKEDSFPSLSLSCGFFQS